MIESSRSVSHGVKSLIVLGVLGSASAILGLVTIGSSTEPGGMGAAHASTSPPPLATTLLSATEFEPGLTPPERVSDTLKSRETLTELVTRLGAQPADAAAALHTIYEKELLDPRRLRPGVKADAFIADGKLTALNIKADAERNLFITRSAEGGWTASELKARLSPTYHRVAAPIETSIYDAARKLGAGDQQVVDFASAFAYDVDFQREIHPGDTFEMVYETHVDERGTPVKNGDLIYARLDGRALTRGFYRFTPSDDGVTDYFDEHGESATKFLMKTPINGARLSSSFGNRRHPISGYTRLHKGTDFAAPTGTPIYAAGNGTIERASRYGGYGNYVRIRHANNYKTAYAHMSRYGPGVRAGKRVRQGDVIGYVGSTGASTGPHLHYEVYIKGKPVNAMRLKLPTGRKLAETPEILTEFEARKAEIDAIRAAQGAQLLAANTTTNPPSP
ncbi:MAG: M23 family metallopeptidase [Hyphomonas sp.]|nr:M23 family metallopeptidase [Hyphomonas sp.]